MVPVLGLFPDTGAIGQPETSPFRLLLGHLQPFLPPNPFHSFMIDDPPLTSQQHRNPSIPIPPIGPRQLDDSRAKAIFIISLLGHKPLRGSTVLEHSTGPAFRHV